MTFASLFRKKRKKSIIYMTTEECFAFFQSEDLKREYADELEGINTSNARSMQYFLDTFAYDVKRLTPSQCELLDLDYEEGYYISTWNMEYLEN